MITDYIREITKCVRCGKCTVFCPMFDKLGWEAGAARGKLLLALGFIQGEVEINDEFVKSFYQCSTCMRCEAECPSGVPVINIIREVRRTLVTRGISIPFSHKGTFDVISKLTRREGFNSNWLNLIEGEFLREGEVVYFPGCLPYIEPLLDFELDFERTISGAIKIFNQAGIRPAIPEDLRCCGHDALWSGQYELFNELKEKNSKILGKAKLIVVSCAECYRTLKKDYSLEGRILHISEFVADLVKEGKLNLGKVEGKVTFHDPCRLGRHMGVYKPPRDVLTRIASYEEMPRSGKEALCCGVGAWINCNKYSELIREERLKEAAGVAGIMITSCTKCLAHFRCLLSEPLEREGLPKIEVRDFTEFVSSNLAG